MTKKQDSPAPNALVGCSSAILLLTAGACLVYALIALVCAAVRWLYVSANSSSVYYAMPLELHGIWHITWVGYLIWVFLFFVLTPSLVLAAVLAVICSIKVKKQALVACIFCVVLLSGFFAFGTLSRDRVLRIWDMRGRLRTARENEPVFRAVQSRVRSEWAGLVAFHGDGAHKRVQGPVQVMICEYDSQSASLDPVKRIVTTTEAGLSCQTAKSPEDLRTLVLVLYDATSYVGESYRTLHYVIVEWPSLAIIDKGSVQPWSKQEDKYPGQLKPFWKDTSFAYETVYHPDWDTLWRDLRAYVPVRQGE